MQHNKYKKNLSEITNYCSESTELTKTFGKLLKGFKFSYINSLLKKVKVKGVEPKNIFQILLVIRFLDFSNIQQLMLSGYSKELKHQKDVLYDFMKNPLINWRRIVWLFVKQVLSIIDKKSDNIQSDSPKCLIVDDSLLPKSGIKIELIGKVFDHCTRTYSLGIKLLTLGFWDGKLFIPLDFSFHNEQGKTKKRGLRAKDLQAQFSKKRDQITPGHTRETEITKDKISVALSMIKTAIKNKIKASYVLADSWFINEPFISGIKKIKKGLHVIGLMRTNRLISINGKKYTANRIPEIKQKQIKYSKKLKCHYIVQTITYKGIEMKAFWVRMKGQQTWKMLISTDKNLTFIKAMRHYQIRWSIEVFFRDCKQNLSLNSCQSTDLDAHIASISIVFMNYMTLCLRKRFDAYETIGGLFKNSKEQLLENTLVEKIWNILIELYNLILAELGVEWEKFISKLIQNQENLEKQIKNTFECLFSLSKTAT